MADSIRSMDFSSGLLSILLVATKQKKAVNFDYISINTGAMKNYTILPLQVKLRRLKKGSQTVLYGQDVNNNNRTKSFVLKNIKNIKVINQKFKRVRKNLLQKYINRDRI